MALSRRIQSLGHICELNGFLLIWLTRLAKDRPCLVELTLFSWIR